MSAPLATPTDVADVWRPLSATEQAAAAVLVEVASDIVRARFTDLDLRLGRGEVAPSIPRHVVAMMVRRYLSSRTPDDPISKSDGPFSRTWVAGAPVEMAMYESDLQLLRPAPKRTRPRTWGFGVGLRP